MLPALLLLIFPPFTFAAPVAVVSQPYNPGACIAILLAFFVFFSVLVSIKHVYMKKRRAFATQYLASCSVSSCTASSAKTSSESVLPMFRPIASKDGSFAAFLVGFLGSPTWETQLNMLNRDTRSLLSASTRSTSTWKSRSTAKAIHPSSNSQEKSSADEFGSKLSHWPTTSSNSRSSKSVYPSDSVSREHSIRLPTPSKLKSTPSITNSLQRQNRRSSLPAAPPSRKADFDRSSLQKRHSSLRSNKARRRSTSSVPYSSSSPRMADVDISQDDTLPLSPDEQHSSTTSLNNDQTMNNNIPPLPALPPPVISADRHSTDTPALINYISHPYPLAPYPKRNKPIEGLPSGTCSALNKAHSQSRTAGLPAAPSSATSSSFPHPQDPFPALSGIKKPRKSSLKVRRSPPLGPSPLRIMTLPEGSITDIASLNFTPSSPQVYNGRSPSQRNSYSHIGLGFPPSDSRRSSVAAKSDDDKRSSTSSRRLTRLNDDGTNVLLGIIRELVEETSQWDADLYMDSNFRHLLENANATRNLDGSLAESPHDAEITSPVQLDEGLIELDAVRSQFMDSEDPAHDVGVAW